MNEREWIEQARYGDQAAVAQLFQRYWRAARAAAFGVTGEWSSAEDAASEGLFQALQTIRSLQDPEKFGAWSRTIVIRKASAAKATSANLDGLPEELASAREHPETELLRRQLAAAIQQAAQRLPARLRETIALVYFEGYSPEEAVQLLGIPPGTLRRRLHEGREMLRTLVGEALQGRRQTSLDRERIERLALEGDLLEATRELLVLRPTPRGLTEKLFSATPQTIECIRQVIEPVCEHPAWETIRKALPEFQEWRIDVAQALRQPESALPPGQGAWIRASRGLAGEDDSSMVELLQRGASLQSLQLMDVVELVWTTVEPMELRAVQELLERLAAAMKQPQPRFASYNEPRYRSALQLSFVGRAAIGGVLLNSPQSAHVRIFLNKWCETS